MNRFFIFTLFFVLISCPILHADSEVPPQQTEQKQTENKNNTLPMLQTLLELHANLKKQITNKKKKLKASSSEKEQELLKAELKKLDNQLSGAVTDFEDIATGVDINLFQEKKTKSFDWQEEIISLLKPGISELKHLTARARQKTKIKDDIAHYDKLLYIAREAISNIKTISSQTAEKDIKKRLQEMLPQWKNIEEQINSKLKISHMKIEQMKNEEISLMESSKASIKNFFRTRGLYLIVAILIFLCIVLLFWILYTITYKIIPGFKANHRSFSIRLLDLFFRFFTILCAFAGFVFVLYRAEDWVLLSLTIVFFIGLGWTIRHTLPKVWNQCRLMLNIGEVREGERIIFYGVPWKVAKINVFTKITNPAMGITLRVPIEDLLNKVSRPLKNDEPWFPCQKNDWVILADGTRGKVISLSHEMVELVERGGAHKMYQTPDFLSQSPKNISMNFRIKETFGISYNLQKQSTSTVLETLESYIRECIENEGYHKELLSLRVEFQQAGASSLDLVVIADFKGEMAPLFNRLRRSIQRWCVDACTINNWEIPFPQLTIHKAA